jgi:argininosuccinate synthase
MDANLLHISYEGRHLEDPSAEAEEDMWRWDRVARGSSRCA